MPHKNKTTRQQYNRKRYKESAKVRKESALATANWKRAHPTETALSGRKSRLKRAFGLSLEDYEKMFQEGNKACWICKKPQESFIKSLNVDHDHKTGEIRGLLCYNCNRNLIGRHTDPNLFLAAYEYLTRERKYGKVPE